MVETVEVAALPLAPRNPLPYLQQMKAAESRMKLVSMTQASLNLAGALDDPFIVSTNLLVGRGSEIDCAAGAGVCGLAGLVARIRQGPSAPRVSARLLRCPR
jgi:hypothetical protein